MLWFFLEALVALLIAVAIVGWTMGFGRRKPRNSQFPKEDNQFPKGDDQFPKGGNQFPKGGKPGDADRDRTG